MDRPCYQNAWWTFAKYNPIWRTTWIKHFHGGQKKRYKENLQAPPPRPRTSPSLKDSNIPTESLEQIAQDRANWRGLIKRGAGKYDAKRINEAEQKRAQRKARAKASSTKLFPQTPLVLSATGSLELRVVPLAILEHTNSSTSRIWFRLVIVSNVRRTIIMR